MHRILLVVFAVIIGSCAASADPRRDCYALRGEARLKACTDAISTFPRDPINYINRAVHLSSINELDRALADVTRGLDLAPKNAFAYSLRGAIHLDKRDNDRAIEDLNKAIALDPTISRSFYRRGLAYQRKGDSERAIADYSKAIDLDPKHAESYLKRGVVYYSVRGDTERFLADILRAIELDPRNDDAYFQRGVYYFNRKEPDRAFADFTKSIELEPRSSAAHFNRAVIQQNRKNYFEALSDYTRAAELNPKDGNTFANRAEIYLALKEVARAEADLKRAVELNPAKAQTYTSDFERAKRVASRQQSATVPASSPSASSAPAETRSQLKAFSGMDGSYGSLSFQTKKLGGTAELLEIKLDKVKVSNTGATPIRNVLIRCGVPFQKMVILSASRSLDSILQPGSTTEHPSLTLSGAHDANYRMPRVEQFVCEILRAERQRPAVDGADRKVFHGENADCVGLKLVDGGGACDVRYAAGEAEPIKIVQPPQPYFVTARFASIAPVTPGSDPKNDKRIQVLATDISVTNFSSWRVSDVNSFNCDLIDPARDSMIVGELSIFLNGPSQSPGGSRPILEAALVADGTFKAPFGEGTVKLHPSPDYDKVRQTDAMMAADDTFKSTITLNNRNLVVERCSVKYF